MKKDILNCPLSKVKRHNRNVSKEISILDEHFGHIHMIIIILLEVKGYKYCLTLTDWFSRWPEAIQQKVITADTIVTNFYNIWISRFSTLKNITTDQGYQSKSGLFNAPKNSDFALPLSIKWVCRALALINESRVNVPTDSIVHRFTSCCNVGTKDIFQRGFKGHACRSEILRGKFREHVWQFWPALTAQHGEQSLRMFARVLANRFSEETLEPPYWGPYEIIDCLDDYVFTINDKGKPTNVSTKRLKPDISISHQRINDLYKKQLSLRTYANKSKLNVTFKSSWQNH